LATPTPYPPRTPEEIQAVNKLKDMLDPHQVIAHVEVLNTVPNVDGHLEVLDDSLRPIAKLEVQVKKLPDNYGATPQLHPKVGLFGYAAEATANPVLLIGVDVDHEKAYWVHIQPEANKGLGQATVTVSLPTTQVVDRINRRYVADWVAISRETRRKLREFSKYEQGYSRLTTIVNAAAGLAKDDFREIHVFLDDVNSFLDGDFSLIKRRYFPTAWKVGLAYHEYTQTSVAYAIYPIAYDLNDIQIKEIDFNLRNELIASNGMTMYSTENPIKTRSKSHAWEFVDTRLQQILKYQILEHRGSESLATEFLIAFVDHFADQMGLNQKEAYSLAEIEQGFYHMLLWTHQAVRLLVSQGRYANSNALTFGRDYFDPKLLWSLVATSLYEIETSIRQAISSGDPVPTYPLGSEELPFGIFVECESFLVSKGIKEIHRLYRPPDYSAATGLKWSVFSVSDLAHNLRAFFNEYPGAYASIIQQNFPRLIHDLKPFGGASYVVAFFDAKDEGNGVGYGPIITLHYLECLETKSGLRVDLYKRGQRPDLEHLFDHSQLGDTISIDGTAYVRIGGPTMTLDFIYEKLPIFKYIYTELETDFRDYFKDRISSS
jgi:hypothetical protein